MTVKSWLSIPKPFSKQEEDKSSPDFSRVCPDRSRSSSRPLPPPSSCFAKFLSEELEAAEKEDKELTKTEVEEEEDDDTSLSEESLEDFGSYLPKQTQATPQPAMEAIMAARRRNSNFGSSIRSFFDSFRQGEVEEVDFEIDDSADHSPQLDKVFMLL